MEPNRVEVVFTPVASYTVDGRTARDVPAAERLSLPYFKVTVPAFDVPLDTIEGLVRAELASLADEMQNNSEFVLSLVGMVAAVVQAKGSSV